MIYIIRAIELNRVKIGTTSGPSVAQRLSQLRTGCPTELALLATFEGGFEEESRLHRRFAYLRTHGEWFEYAPELREFVESKCRKDEEYGESPEEITRQLEKFVNERDAKKEPPPFTEFTADEEDEYHDTMSQAAGILAALNAKYGNRNALGECEIHNPAEQLRVVLERLRAGFYQDGI